MTRDRARAQNRGLPGTTRGGLGNEGRGRTTYEREPASLLAG